MHFAPTPLSVQVTLLFISFLLFPKTVISYITCPFNDRDPIALTNKAVEKLYVKGRIAESELCLKLAYEFLLAEASRGSAALNHHEILNSVKQNLDMVKVVLTPGGTAGYRYYYRAGDYKSNQTLPDSRALVSNKSIDNSIGVWDGALTSAQCRSLISLYEKSDIYVGNIVVNGEVIENPPGKKATEFAVTNHARLFPQSEWAAIDGLLVSLTIKYLIKYTARNLGMKTQKNPLGEEGFRMKRYLNNEIDHHAFHVDGGHESNFGPKRVVAVLIYLNEVTEGGETVFFDQAVEVVPKCGRVLIFPTGYTHPHAGRKPISGPKYIIANFLTT